MKYRVWTVDWHDKVTCHTDWQGKRACEIYIAARWKHWPPFVYVSSCQTEQRFRKVWKI